MARRASQQKNDWTRLPEPAAAPFQDLANARRDRAQPTIFAMRAPVADGFGQEPTATTFWPPRSCRGRRLAADRVVARAREKCAWLLCCRRSNEPRRRVSFPFQTASRAESCQRISLRSSSAAAHAPWSIRAARCARRYPAPRRFLARSCRQKIASPPAAPVRDRA